MKRVIAAVALAAVVSGPVAAPAMAQDFLATIARAAAQSVAQSAAQRLANRAVNTITAPRPAAAPAPASAAPPASTPARTAQANPLARLVAGSGLPADFPAPVPINYSPDLRSPDDLRFSEADKKAKAYFMQFGRVVCPDCRGARVWDAWATYQIPSLWGQYVLQNRLGSMAVGESIRWTGEQSRTAYAITIASEHPIGSWRCKQLQYTARGPVANTDARGLICLVTENWHELL